MSDAWFRFRRAPEGARLRLFCLPYAGGGASVFRRWPEALAGDGIDAVPVQPPGREERLREPAFTRAEPLVAALVAAIRPLLDRPFALFGHSMGAILAFELARALDAEGRPPVHLIVSAQRGPSVPLGRPATYDLPPAAFRMRLRELSGTPEAVLADPEMMALLLPLLRADFELSETYLRRARAPLGCPVTALGGSDDAEVSRAELEAWAGATRGPFRLAMLPGGHFFVQSAAPAVLALVREALA